MTGSSLSGGDYTITVWLRARASRDMHQLTMILLFTHTHIFISKEKQHSLSSICTFSALTKSEDTDEKIVDDVICCAMSRWRRLLLCDVAVFTNLESISECDSVAFALTSVGALAVLSCGELYVPAVSCSLLWPCAWPSRWPWPCFCCCLKRDSVKKRLRMDFKLPSCKSEIHNANRPSFKRLYAAHNGPKYNRFMQHQALRGENCMYLVFATNESLERARSFCKAYQMVCPKFAPDLNNYSFSVCESLVT